MVLVKRLQRQERPTDSSLPGKGEASSVFLTPSLKTVLLGDCLNTTLCRKRGRACRLSLRTNLLLVPKYKCDPDGTK